MNAEAETSISSPVSAATQSPVPSSSTSSADTRDGSLTDKPAATASAAVAVNAPETSAAAPAAIAAQPGTVPPGAELADELPAGKTRAEIQRANRIILLAMIVFALLLAIACFLWMCGVMRAREGGGNAFSRSAPPSAQTWRNAPRLSSL